MGVGWVEEESRKFFGWCGFYKIAATYGINVFRVSASACQDVGWRKLFFEMDLSCPSLGIITPLLWLMRLGLMGSGLLTGSGWDLKWLHFRMLTGMCGSRLLWTVPHSKQSFAFLKSIL